MGRLTRIHVASFALLLLVGIAAASVMMLVKPRQQTIAKLTQRIDEEEKKAAERPRVEAELTRAQAQTAAVRARWQTIMDTKMSHTSLADPYTAMFVLNKEVETYAPQLTAALNSNRDIRFTGQLGFSGVGWTPPSPALAKREFPQGGFALQARNFPALLNWLRNTQSLPRVMQLGNNISLTGPAPWVSVGIPATFYINYRTGPGTAESSPPPAAAPVAGPPQGMPGTPGGGVPPPARAGRAKAAPADEDMDTESLGRGGLGKKRSRALATEEEE